MVKKGEHCIPGSGLPTQTGFQSPCAPKGRQIWPFLRPTKSDLTVEAGDITTEESPVQVYLKATMGNSSAWSYPPASDLLGSPTSPGLTHPSLGAL